MKILLILISLNFGMALYPQNSDRSAALKTEFQRELASLYEQYDFPGATAAYILPDGSVETFAVGYADVENNLKMKPGSRMLAASIGKTFVGATVLALAQEKVLSLDDPISKWLSNEPWFSDLPNHNEITIRQLLNHTSGIGNHVYEEAFAEAFKKNWQTGKNPFTPEKLISYILKKEPLFQPGKGWSYSDTGYIITGLIIEKVTGNSYYQEVKDRFLEPLNLAKTEPSNSLELENLAAGYMAADNSFNLPAKTTGEPEVMVWHPGIEWTGGGLISNPGDLVIWGKSLYEGKAMKGNYTEELLKFVPVSTESQDTQYAIAVALYKSDEFGNVYGHSGWIPGYSSKLRYYPEYKTAIAFQINTDIGIVDDSTKLFEEMEANLAVTVIKHIKK
ncbi:MAG: beta-lactamase family protein [Candidatus Cloacimonetes bacterium]|nr:beta-lactamase family protein [Candidatus Cloacimonadota bacterium]